MGVLITLPAHFQKYMFFKHRPPQEKSSDQQDSVIALAVQCPASVNQSCISIRSPFLHHTNTWQLEPKISNLDLTDQSTDFHYFNVYSLSFLAQKNQEKAKSAKRRNQSEGWRLLRKLNKRQVFIHFILFKYIIPRVYSQF